VGPDFKPNAVPEGTPPLSAASADDMRLVHDFIAAMAADDAGTRAFVTRYFSDTYRKKAGDDALVEKIGGLSPLWKPRIISIYRDGNDTAVLFETQESEHPRLYRLTFSRSGPGGMIDSYLIKRASQ
jgi:hypothetical protein